LEGREVAGATSDGALIPAMKNAIFGKSPATDSNKLTPLRKWCWNMVELTILDEIVSNY
jgi:hypothetical protein